MGDREGLYDYVIDIDYKGYKVNLAEYGESRKHICKKREMQTNRKEFQFPSELSVTEKT